MLYAARSSPKPSLWPPALKFLPSTRADKVNTTPEKEKESVHSLNQNNFFLFTLHIFKH